MRSSAVNRIRILIHIIFCWCVPEIGARNLSEINEAFLILPVQSRPCMFFIPSTCLNQQLNENNDGGKKETLSDALDNLFQQRFSVNMSNENVNHERNKRQLLNIQIDDRMKKMESNGYPNVKDLNGVYLDSGEYAAYSNTLPYTSLKSEVETPSVGSTSMTKNLQHSPQNPSFPNQNVNITNRDPEDLYHQVFKNEQGYFNQTKDFKTNLLGGSDQGADDGDVSLIEGYLKDKRQNEYKKKQEQALQKIDEEIIDIEKKLKEKKEKDAKSKIGDQKSSQCEKCGSPLTSFELGRGSSICHICHAEELSYSSYASLSKGDRKLRNTRQPINERPRQYNRDMFSDTKSAKYRSQVNRSVSGKSSSLISRQNRQGDGQGQSSNPLKKKSRINIQRTERNQDESFTQLKDAVKKYKTLYEEANKEIVELKNLVSNLEKKIDSVFDTDSSATVASASVGAGKEANVLHKTDDSIMPHNGKGENIWVELTDPNSGNLFMWNKNTGEVKWKSEL